MEALRLFMEVLQVVLVVTVVVVVVVQVRVDHQVLMLGKVGVVEGQGLLAMAVMLAIQDLLLHAQHLTALQLFQGRLTQLQFLRAVR